MNRRFVGPVPSQWRRVMRREEPYGLATAAVIVLAVLLVAVGVTTRSEQLPIPSDPAVIADSKPVDTELYRDPQMLAIAAAREDSRLNPIAETPQAKWFSDWSTTAAVQRDVRDYLWGATLADAIATIVLYRIPHLDCGGNALAGQVYTGARDEQEYREWVDGAAAALMGHSNAIVIIEPDALAQLGQCDHGDRVSTLQYAVDVLSRTSARVYVDAGHGNWLSSAEAANRLRTIGVDKIAGFSLNVANYNATEDEVRYAESVRSELSNLGITQAHYVIDVGRNGAGAQDTYCNAPGARLGHAPELFQGGALDGLLWVKNPGETDGVCQAGPAIGFWPEGALRLLGLDEGKGTGTRNTTERIALLLFGGVAAAAVLGFAVFRRRRGAGAAEEAAK